MLDEVALTGREHDRVGGYSYGMRQRLGVAASLMRDPRLLVLDEPANGLDPGGIRDMRALVKRLAAGGLTVLLSSHHMDEVEEICDEVTIMSAGAVAFRGSLADLRAQAPDPGHLLRTSDDRRAATVGARAHHRWSWRRPRRRPLRDRLARARAAYVSDLVGSGLGLFELTPT